MRLRLVMHNTVRLRKRLNPGRMRLALLTWALEANSLLRQAIAVTVKRGETGRLSTDIGFELIRTARAFGVRFTPRAPYALAVERGVAPHYMEPRLASVMAWQTSTEQTSRVSQDTETWRFSRGHVHPGFGPKLYFRRALQFARPVLRQALKKSLAFFARGQRG